MLITDIQIDGIPQHEKLSLENLKSFNVIVGPNNSGKSAVLDVIYKLSLFTSTTPSSQSARYQSKQFYSKTRKNYTVKWRFNASLTEIFGNVDNALKAFKELKSEELKHSLAEFGLSTCLEIQVRYGDNAIGHKKPFGPIQVKDKIIFDSKNFNSGFMMDNLSNSTRSYFEEYVNELTRVHDISKAQLISYVPCHRMLKRKEIMLDLRDHEHSTKYNNFVTEFKETFPSFPLVRHAADETYSIIGRDKDEREIMFPFKEEGGGCLRTFQIASEIFLLGITKAAASEKYRQNIRPILIIDEPELSMHADLQRKLFHNLVKFSHNAQIFIATHLPIFISPSQNRKVILLPLARTDNEVKEITRPNINDVSVALGLNNKDYFINSVILFVEGDTEEKFLSTILNESEIDLLDYGVVLKNMAGVDYLQQEFSNLLIQLILDFNAKVFIITDKEGTARKKKDKLIKIFQKEQKVGDFDWHIWDSNFEAHFPKEVLFETLKQTAKQKDIELGLTFEDFNKQLSSVDDKAIPNKLREIYYTHTKGTLNMKIFGYSLAKVIVEGIEKYKNLEVIKYFCRLFDKMGIRIFPNVERYLKGVYFCEEEKRIADEEKKE